jgi:transposase
MRGASRTPPLSLTDDQRLTLDLRSQATTRGRALARRIAIILMSADGVAADEIAKVIGVNRSVVYHWRMIFRRSGLDGVLTSRKPHTSRRYGPDVRQQIHDLMATPPPDRHRWWTAKLIAARISGVKHTYISEIIRRMGIDLRAGRRRIYPY